MPHKSGLLVRRLRRFTALSNSDRRLLWRAFVALAMVDLGLRTRGFRSLIDQAQAGVASDERSVGVEDLARARRYARWVRVASRFHVVPAHCLHRSLTLHRWLLKEGLPSNLRIGVRKENGELKAHAWVELGGETLNDPPDAVASFTPLSTVGGEKPTWARSGRSPGLVQLRATTGGAPSWR